mmetsp:Transcript_14977/g.45205  ORF Transcript_14977/g.45205 Transcript_14977/m.45205 type:complete len:243 (+) Transcript_14977:115-843(+)
MSPKQQARRALVVLLKSKLNSLFDELVWVLFLGHKDPWLSEVKFELSAAPGSDPCSKTIWKLHADYGRVPPDLLIGQSEDPVGKRCQKRVKLDYETSGVRQTPADRHPCCTAQQRTPVRCTCAKHRRPPSPTRGYGTSAIACGDLQTHMPLMGTATGTTSGTAPLQSPSPGLLSPRPRRQERGSAAGGAARRRAAARRCSAYAPSLPPLSDPPPAPPGLPVARLPVVTTRPCRTPVPLRDLH